jgi:hypothetical protein
MTQLPRCLPRRVDSRVSVPVVEEVRNDAAVACRRSSQRAETVFERRPGWSPTPPGHFSIDLDSAWSSLVGIHGGYLSPLPSRSGGQPAGDRPIRPSAQTSCDRTRQVGPSSAQAARSRTRRTSPAAKTVLISQVIAAKDGESTAWDTSALLDLRPIECVHRRLTASDTSPTAWRCSIPPTFPSAMGLARVRLHATH